MQSKSHEKGALVSYPSAVLYPCTASDCRKRVLTISLERLHRGLNASAATRRRTPFSSSGERWPLHRGPTGVARQTCTYETATSLLCVDDGHIEQALDAGHGHLETRSIGRGKHRREGLIASPHYQHQLACS
jgi:hypothetical protein